MRIAVVGGGAAGMMCAAAINELNPKIEIFLLEKNDSLGKKVIISGGGRCNVTTGFTDIKVVLSKYPRGGKFLNSAMHRFPPAAVKAWFANHNVPLKCEADGRLFPLSNKGEEVVKVFENIFALHKTTLLFKHTVKHIAKTAQGFRVDFATQPSLAVDRVVLALGGQARRYTGSTGDGYSLAEQLGHHITPLAPSLNAFTTQEQWPARLTGVSLIKVKIQTDTPKYQAALGPLVFTHWGISGPAVFALSSLMAFVDYSATKPLAVYIDLLPDLTVATMAAELKSLVSVNPKKSFKNTLHNFVPLSVAELICRQLSIPPEQKNAAMSKYDLHQVEQRLKHLPLNVIGRRAGDEFVTAGGVELTEVDPRTMQSKVCAGLYLVGEILNIDGFTGGFNLQSAWATGQTAGASLAAE
ncbi:MAG: aminoacetone oxidase family FAD-binding enzyme [Patescibacteria group bacterium]